MDDHSIPTIRDLYPHLTDAELAQAEDNLERYIAVVLRIFERLERETSPLASEQDLVSFTKKQTGKSSE